MPDFFHCLPSEGRLAAPFAYPGWHLFNQHGATAHAKEFIDTIFSEGGIPADFTFLHDSLRLR
jgi:hypothetical protein